MCPSHAKQPLHVPLHVPLPIPILLLGIAGTPYYIQLYLCLYLSTCTSIRFWYALLLPVPVAVAVAVPLPRFCWYAWLPVSRGPEEGALWQACRHLGMR